MEVFDRIIGAEIDELSTQRVFDAYMAFVTAAKAQTRSKIKELLLSTLTEHLDELLASQLITLSKVLL